MLFLHDHDWVKWAEANRDKVLAEFDFGIGDTAWIASQKKRQKMAVRLHPGHEGNALGSAGQGGPELGRQEGGQDEKAGLQHLEDRDENEMGAGH